MKLSQSGIVVMSKPKTEKKNRNYFTFLLVFNSVGHIPPQSHILDHCLHVCISISLSFFLWDRGSVIGFRNFACKFCSGSNIYILI